MTELSDEQLIEAGFTRGIERAAVIDGRFGQSVYIYDPYNRQLQNDPTHERVVWRGPWEPEPRCPTCRQRFRDLVGYPHDCPPVAAGEVHP